MVCPTCRAHRFGCCALISYVCFLPFGSRVACVSLERMAWASKMRLVLSVPEVCIALDRVARARAADLCLFARRPDWRRDNAVATMEKANRAAWGLPAELREGAGLQRRIASYLQSPTGLDRLCVVLARRAGRLHGALIPAGRIALVLDRLRVLFAPAGASVAIGALRVVVNGPPTTRLCGQGPQVCPFGCHAAGGDDVRQMFFCPVLESVFAARREWVRPGWLAGGDLTTLRMLMPTEERMTIVHGAWMYVVCRAYSGIRHAGGVAQQADAHRRMLAEFRSLLTRRPVLRRALLV